MDVFQRMPSKDEYRIQRQLQHFWQGPIFHASSCPLSIVVSNLIKLGIQSLLFVLMLLYYVFFQDYDMKVTPYLLLLPLMIILMAMLGLSLGMIISSLTTKYRGLGFSSHIWCTALDVCDTYHISPIQFESQGT